LGKKYNRDTLIIAAGGGVVGDLAGYAAATFMRGVQLVHLPTTLLAMVDSSIGGKTGINFNKNKNIIGAFFQPEFVMADLEFLKTLPKSEIICGTGEIIKYAYLSNNDFFNYVNDNLNEILICNLTVLDKVISESVKIKSAVVKQDEKETGLRKILNLGHTFAHAYESELNFRIKHGEAVIAGLISALYLSNRLKILSKEKFDRFIKLPLKINLSAAFNKLNKENVYNRMFSDKKSRGGRIKFVLLADTGKILIDVDASKADIYYALENTLEHFT
jgi:3-dehydroquinate synthase